MEGNPLYFYPKDHMSISALNSFSNCPFSFYMSYFLGVRPKEKSKLTFGKQFQDLLNAKYRGQDTKAALSLVDAKKRGLASLLLSKAYDFDDIVSVDEHYNLDLGFGIPFEFAPDLTTKKGIVENKCTTGYYNASMVNDEKQGTVYYLGVKKMTGIKNPTLHYQIFNTITQESELVNSPRSDKDIDKLMDWLEMRLKQMERCYLTGLWDTGEHGFCNFKNVCPLQEKYGKNK